MKQTRRDPNDNSFYCECKGCWWWRGGSGIYFCHYCHETGEPRGVLPKDCYKHPGTPYMTAAEGRKFEREQKAQLATIKKISNGRRKEKKMANHGNYSTETKEAAVKAVLVDKEPQSVVCERFCIAKSTLGKWVTDAKKQQKAFIDYVEEIEAEQSRAEQSRAAHPCRQCRNSQAKRKILCRKRQSLSHRTHSVTAPFTQGSHWERKMNLTELLTGCATI